MPANGRWDLIRRLKVKSCVTGIRREWVQGHTLFTVFVYPFFVVSLFVYSSFNFSRVYFRLPYFLPLHVNLVLT